MSSPRQPRETKTHGLEPLAVLPVFVPLQGKRAVLAGSSGGAPWKVKLLAAAGAQVDVLARSAFLRYRDEDLAIFYGAYLGMADEILVAGPLALVADEIVEKRAEARALEGPAGIAIALNGRVVCKKDWAETRLSEGDRIEIVRAMQGG